MVNRTGLFVCLVVAALAAVVAATLVSESVGPAAASAKKLAQPSKVKIVNAGSGKAVVSWQGSYGGSSYRVRYGKAKSLSTKSGAKWTQTSAGDAYLVLTKLKAGTKYYVAVRALAAKGSKAHKKSSYTSAVSFKTVASRELHDFGVMSYNMLCADYCVETARHNIDTFPWLKRRARVVDNIKSAANVDIIGMQEAGGYVATGWNCRYLSSKACAMPAKFAPDGVHGAYDRFCSVAQCPTRVPDGLFNGTPRQIDDIMRFLPDFGITDIAGDPNAKETGFSYLRIMWRKSTFDLVHQGSWFDIDGDAYEAKVNWHRKAYWAVLRQKSTGQKYFVVTAHPVSNTGVSTTEGYPKGARASDVRAAGARKMLATIRSLNTEGLPVIVTADMNAGDASDGSLAVMAHAGYVNTRSSVSASHRINNNVRSYNGFNPAKMQKSGTATPYDYVFVHPATDGPAITTGMSWLQATARGKYVYNCRSASHASKTPTAGCWGSDHFPLIAQIWQAR